MISTAVMLEQVDVVRLRLHLEFDEDSNLPSGFALQLRRELLGAGRTVLDRESFSHLFEPEGLKDPQSVRRFQRPSPGFIIKAGSTSAKAVRAGDDWQLEILFFGAAIDLMSEFIRVFRHVGKCGIHQGQGRFTLVAVSSLSASGEFAELPLSGRGSASLAPHLLPLSWLVETVKGDGRLRLELMTPARLVSHGKPLFHPDFKALFPFILRRVGAMLWHWGDGQIEMDPQPFFAAAAGVEVLENHLCWQDWRALPGSDKGEGLGGVTGSLVLSGPALDDIFWILNLGVLLHIGKGAAYGAGEYRLCAIEN